MSQSSPRTPVAPKHQPRRTLALRSPQAGPATSEQEAIAALVLDQVRYVRPDLKNVQVDAAQMVTATTPTTLTPADVQMAERLQKALNAMSDADLGRTVRQSGRLFTRYVQESSTPSAELLQIGVRALQAGIVGLMRGGASAAVRGFTEEHARFDRLLLMAVNGEITVARADAEQFVETQRRDLQTEIACERAALADEHQRLHDEREMALSAVSGAQAEATGLRRELDAQRAAHQGRQATADAEILRLTGLLESERSATINRERAARNELHQLRQDLAASRTVIASLNAECERLEAQAAAPTPVEVDPMEAIRTLNALECASLCVYLRRTLDRPTITWKQEGVLFGLPADDLRPHMRAWRAAYPTPDAMLTQMRAVVRPMLGQVTA